MNATRNELNRWAAASERTCAECEQAELLLLEIGEQNALAHVTRARDTAWTTYRSLLDAGADPVEGFGVPAPVPLSLLDTHATRRLLDALESAADAAADVDKERGHVLADGTPCALSETIGDIAQRLRIEVLGPKSARGE